MLEKVSDKFIKSLKENKNKKGLISVIKIKLKNFQDTFDLSKQKMIDGEEWIVKKIDANCNFGHYRIIVAQNKSSKNFVYDFYFKNSKDDLSNDEIKNLRNFLKECESYEYLNRLQNLYDL